MEVTSDCRRERISSDVVRNCENNDTVVANSRQWAVIEFGDFVRC